MAKDQAKWLSTQALHLVLDSESPGPNERRPRPLGPNGNVVRVGGEVTLSRLPVGLVGGRTVVVFQVDLDDGSTVCFEASLRLLESAVVAFKARDQVEGRAV